MIFKNGILRIIINRAKVIINILITRWFPNESDAGFYYRIIGEGRQWLSDIKYALHPHLRKQMEGINKEL